MEILFKWDGIVQPSVFHSIGTSAVPDLWDAPGEVNPDKVLSFFAFTKKQLAQAYGLPSLKIPPTDQLPEPILKRIYEWALIIQDVAGFFNGDLHKTELWLQTPNPMLGGVEPRTMIQVGRTPQLHQIVREAIAGELP